MKLTGPFPSCSIASSSSSGTLTLPVRVGLEVTQAALPGFPGSEGERQGQLQLGDRWGRGARD